MRWQKRSLLLAVYALVPACTARHEVKATALPPVAAAAKWTPQMSFPAPEGDLAYVRSYANYTPDQDASRC